MPIKVGEQHKNARQSFLAGIAMLVNQVLLVSDILRQHISPKHICQLHLPRQRENHGVLFNAQEAAVCHCPGRRHAGRLTGDGILAHKITITQ